MSLNITRAEAERLFKQVSSAKASAKRAREKAGEVVDTVVATSEVSMSAFALGVINGRWGGVEVVGVPLDLLVAGSGKVLAYAGVAPEHMHNFSDGAAASYFVTLGAGIGREMAEKAGQGQVPAQVTAGGGYRPLSDAALHQMAR